MSTSTALYRHFDKEGNLLYVGISKNPFIRLQIHSQRSSWIKDVANITIEWHPTRKIAEDYEDAAIKSEDPLYNIKGNPRNGLMTNIETVKSGKYLPNGKPILYIPIKLNRATEKIVEKVTSRSDRISKNRISDVLFAHSKEYDEFCEFKEKNSDLLGGNRRVVLITYSGDIYSHLKVIERNVDDFESTIEALFMFYHEKNGVYPEPTRR
jgi:hypothetical protein